ncbi:MAG: cell division ATP-binding protein FtsE [Clostridiales bacterium]|nr:cell division ATP-binding protein FtsE [Clostridiales bacterium]
MIRFENVHKTYKTGTDALRGVTFVIRDGEFVFIIGKSGSGKSTLMKCITREEKPTEGLVIIDKFCISKMPRALVPILRRQIGIIYQDFRLIETKTVEENIAFAGEIIGVPKKKLHQMVDIVLGAVGLRDKANSMPLELSGGEQQRVAIARAMLNSPKLIVADEPTGNLDPETSESIMALLQEINRNGTTVVVCTHDSNLVDRMKKRVIEVEDGLIIRDEFGSGYTAEDKMALPKSMIDEFTPEKPSAPAVLLDTPEEKPDEDLPKFPTDAEETVPAKPIKKEESLKSPSVKKEESPIVLVTENEGSETESPKKEEIETSLPEKKEENASKPNKEEPLPVFPSEEEDVLPESPSDKEEEKGKGKDRWKRKAKGKDKEKGKKKESRSLEDFDDPDIPSSRKEDRE